MTPSIAGDLALTAAYAGRMTDRRRVVLAGGSGFLGISLANHLHSHGFLIVILSRSVPKVSGPWEHRTWDGRSVRAWRNCLDGMCAGVRSKQLTVLVLVDEA